MEFDGLPGEPLPLSRKGSIIASISTDHDFQENATNLTDEEVNEKVENILLERIREGNHPAFFQLGQLYFEQGKYDKAKKYFERARDFDFQALFQLGVILYDGLTGKPDYKEGVDCMTEVALSRSKNARHLVRVAQYNVGRAHYQGFGVERQSDEQAERWWLLAVDDGNPNASIMAQTMLGMFYSREETLDLKKAYFWHSEACGNGSLESQGCLGVMLELGLGCKKDESAAFDCFKEAADRGNVYAMGHLVKYYYLRKLYTKAADLASRVAILEDVQEMAAETNCIPSFVAKGISMGCFFYARALHLGHGVKIDDIQAQKFYTKAYTYDDDMCARLQNVTTHGGI